MTAIKYYKGSMQMVLLRAGFVSVSCATSWRRKKTKLDFDSQWRRENTYKVTATQINRQTTQILNTGTQTRMEAVFISFVIFFFFFFLLLKHVERYLLLMSSTKNK